MQRLGIEVNSLDPDLNLGTIQGLRSSIGTFLTPSKPLIGPGGIKQLLNAAANSPQLLGDYPGRFLPPGFNPQNNDMLYAPPPGYNPRGRNVQQNNVIGQSYLNQRPNVGSFYDKDAEVLPARPRGDLGRAWNIMWNRKNDLNYGSDQ